MRVMPNRIVAETLGRTGGTIERFGLNLSAVGVRLKEQAAQQLADIEAVKHAREIERFGWNVLQQARSLPLVNQEGQPLLVNRGRSLRSGGERDDVVETVGTSRIVLPLDDDTTEGDVLLFLEITAVNGYDVRALKPSRNYIQPRGLGRKGVYLAAQAWVFKDRHEHPQVRGSYEYDSERNELVYRDPSGQMIKTVGAIGIDYDPNTYRPKALWVSPNTPFIDEGVPKKLIYQRKRITTPS